MPGPVDARIWLLGPAMLVTTSCIGCLPGAAAPFPAAARQDAVSADGESAPLLAADARTAIAVAYSPGDFERELQLALEPERPPRAWRYIVLHHTATLRGDVRSIDEQHRRQVGSDGRPWLGIGYHFLIGNGEPMRDGQIEATFRWREQLHGAHAGDAKMNDQGIGVCLVGNFEERPPTAAQLAACRRLVAELAGRYDIPQDRVLGHNAVKATACPGKLFPLEEIAASARAPRSRRGADEEVFLSPEAASTETGRHARTVWPDLSESTRRR